MCNCEKDVVTRQEYERLVNEVQELRNRLDGLNYKTSYLNGRPHIDAIMLGRSLVKEYGFGDNTNE